VIVIQLPFPPSVNSLFAGKARRYTSARYRAWKSEAAWEVVRQKARPMAGIVSIEVILTAPDKRSRDASNYIKAIEDLLVSQGIIADDNSQNVKGVSARWSDGRGRPGATVKIVSA
jgi:Holliday junction resolvase RusA-like endonuclease